MMRHGGKQLCDIIGLKLKPNTHTPTPALKEILWQNSSSLDVIIQLAFWRVLRANNTPIAYFGSVFINGVLCGMA
jgi:hypothetical protein